MLKPVLLIIIAMILTVIGVMLAINKETCDWEVKKSKTTPYVKYKNKDKIVDINLEDDVMVLEGKEYKSANLNIANDTLLKYTPVYEGPMHDHNIPKTIWQTLNKYPGERNPLRNAIDTFKSQKGWDYRFVDDQEGVRIMKEYFDPKVLKAFNKVIPGAFKADILRLCLLYRYGGVYADIKINLRYPLNSFLTEDLVLVKDVPSSCIWNGFMAATPKHPYIKLFLDLSVDNVLNERYGDDSLDITGPLVGGRAYNMYYNAEYSEALSEIEIGEFQGRKIMKFIKHKNILFINETGNHERMMDFQKGYHKSYDASTKMGYGDMWKSRRVFNEG